MTLSDASTPRTKHRTITTAQTVKVRVRNWNTGNHWPQESSKCILQWEKWCFLFSGIRMGQ